MRIRWRGLELPSQVVRDKESSTDFYSKFMIEPFYNLFLDMQILTGKIKAEGYFTARNKKDVILLQAYRNARFTGPGVPQADPGREVKAEVEKIKNNLSTHEQAIERLNGGDDFDTIVDKLGTERKRINEVMPKEEIEGSVNNGGAD